ncbi:MAG TPA: porin family protein [Candidatus Aminicenantes bacterium]|nr:porin family protein [Candidatus Aminicenantes bacterium]HRY65299.1 porin family protein [Candidatus Aminicenantes bacterium]HRZ72233.1 porin family protein [Candidatus Aminicenantes bacterium]
MFRRILPCLAAACVLASVSPAWGAGVGLKLGFSLSKFVQEAAVPPALDWSRLPFFAGGLTFESRLGALSIQPELLLVRMGGRYASDPDNGFESRLDYAQVPLLLKLGAAPRGRVDPFVCVGGYGSYLIKARGIIEAAGEKTAADLTGEYERFDFGIVAGAGLTWRRGEMAVSIEGRFGLGLANVLRDPAPGDSLKNRSLMAFVTIVY